MMSITFIHLSGKPDQSHHRQAHCHAGPLLAKMDAETKKKKLQEEHNLSMTIKLEKEMNDMYNLSADIREDGRLETTIEFIKNIMFKNNLLPKKQWNYSALTKPNILAIWRCCKTD